LGADKTPVSAQHAAAPRASKSTAEKSKGKAAKKMRLRS
jgi:hypothetical protein